MSELLKCQQIIKKKLDKWQSHDYAKNEEITLHANS